MKLKNKKLNDEEFSQERKQVLATWPTGAEVNLGEGIAFHRSMPPHKNFALKLLQARDTKTTLIRCESGIPTLDEFSSYLRYLQNEGQADLLGSHIDSLTRNQRYQEAERGLQESVQTGKWVLNGFPIVAHGVAGTRKLIEEIDLPMMLRNPCVDQRLVAEIGFASGYTGTSGDPTMALCHYSRNIPFEDVIRKYQYVYRLMGYYTERGIPLIASFLGGFAILCPFSVVMAGSISAAIIAAEQGVKNFSMAFNTQGNVVQDVAASVVLRKLTKEYLDTLGYQDVEITLDMTIWSGQFPDDEFSASTVINLGVFAAVAAKSELTTVKTIEESKTIPTREASAGSLRLGKTLINILKKQDLQLDVQAVATEAKMLEMETRLIVNKILDLGNGDAAVGLVKATASGVFDNPFATSQYVQCKVRGVRDYQGAVRYLDRGNLPFNQEIIQFHQEKIAEREKAEGKKLDYQTIIDDLASISKCRI